MRSENHTTTATTPVGEAVHAAAGRIRDFMGASARPRVALILGSGLGDYAERLTDARSLAYDEIGFPASGVIGHKGRLVYGRAPGSSLEVLAMQGRVHAYEGHSLQTVVLPVRALVRAGCEIILLTNAATTGGITLNMESAQRFFNTYGSIISGYLFLIGKVNLRRSSSSYGQYTKQCNIPCDFHTFLFGYLVKKLITSEIIVCLFTHFRAWARHENTACFRRKPGFQVNSRTGLKTDGATRLHGNIAGIDMFA